MIKFNAKLLAATALAKSVEEKRYYLNGVYFDGTYAVATDGHMLTISHDPHSQVDKNGIYPISKKTITAMKKTQAEIVYIEDNILSVCDGNGNVLHMEPCTEIDGTYPDYHRVIPEDRGGATLAAFRMTLMKLVCDTQTIIGGVGFRITGADDTAPHIVSYESCHDIFSVLMPYKEHNHYSALPGWYVRPDTAEDDQPEAAA